MPERSFFDKVFPLMGRYLSMGVHLTRQQKVH